MSDIISAQTIDISTEHDVADIEMCKKINTILCDLYPAHPWMVGVNHKAGTIHVELCYTNKIGRAFPYGFLFHIHKMGNAKEMKKKVMRAGGELLERFRLERGRASSYSEDIAFRNGLDTSNRV